jgi:hypothetical protein
MTRIRPALYSIALASAFFVVLAGAASATTFFVNERGSTTTCLAPGISACPKISEAIARAEKVAGPNTIEVEPETGGTVFNESVELTSNKDAGLTINGEEPGVVILGNKAPGVVAHLAGAVTISNLTVKASNVPSLLHSALVDHVAALTLDNVAVENESGEGMNGIEVRELGSVTMNGGEVIMENGSSGFAVFGLEGELTLNGVTVLTGPESEAEAGGVYSEKSSLSMTDSHVSVETGMGNQIGIAAGKDSSVMLLNDTVRQNSPALGVALENSPTTAEALRVEMLRTSNKVAAVLSEQAATESSTFSDLEVSGTWSGLGLLAEGGDVSLVGSRLTEGSLSEVPVLKYDGSGAGTGLLVRNSALQAQPGAKPGALEVANGNATLDSSEVAGGRNAAFYEDSDGTAHTLTVSASTLDGGAAGIAGDAAGVGGVEAVAKGGPGSGAHVSIQGSIVFETQAAVAAAGDAAEVACAYSAAPSQFQASGGGAGAIACTAGGAGNTEVNPLSSVFAEPFSGYTLSAGSSAIDSVPAGATALPFGLTPSPTDLLGNPRVVDGNGDCAAVQDKGALELQGHAATCIPVAGKLPQTKPLAPSITALSISPDAFHAGAKGATISKAARRKSGAKLGWHDSQAATSTFTVLRVSSGRRQGKSCRKPSRSNRHGHRCKLLVKVGTFSHADKAGANSVHFSGRLEGGKLRPSSYTLKVVAHDAAGTGAAVSRAFKIT